MADIQLTEPQRAIATESGALTGASALARLRRWAADAPAYAPDAADLRTLTFLGLRVPARATVAVMLVALLLLLDYHGRVTDLVAWATGWSTTSDADWKRIQGVGRLLLLGGVPLLVVVIGFRDRPSRYGLRLGDWRAGLAIMLGGIAVMTPIAVAFAHVPAFAAYYAPQAAPAPQVILSTALDVLSAEFFFRGFLLFALLRTVGPIAVVLATLPFAFSHLGKPEVETLSTLGGGFLYGWLDWRTGSVLWSGLAHTWTLACLVLASAAAGVPGS